MPCHLPKEASLAAAQQSVHTAWELRSSLASDGEGGTPLTTEKHPAQVLSDEPPIEATRADPESGKDFHDASAPASSIEQQSDHEAPTRLDWAPEAAEDDPLRIGEPLATVSGPTWALVRVDGTVREEFRCCGYEVPGGR